MKGKKRKGSTLSMVIIATIIVVVMVAIMASVIDSNTLQTTRVYQYLNAKYVATSGSQLTLGAYYEDRKINGSLYRELAERATSKKSNTDKITSSQTFDNGKADIEITGEFAVDPTTNRPSTNSNDYNITIKSRAKVDGMDRYYVHTVVFNWATEGIKSEKGGLEP